MAKKRVRRWPFVVAIGGAVLAVVYLLRTPILIGAARFLTVSDDLRPADAIYLLNGEIESRPAGAAELYHRGLAPVIVFAREEQTQSMEAGLMANLTDVTRALLRRFGVPDSAIVIVEPVRGVTSTLEEAEAFRAYAERSRPRTVIVVTNSMHTRRARWTLRRALDDLQVDVLAYPVPHRHFDETNWWRREAGQISYILEYIKFAHYWLRS
jgi:uncharacterized SAM-binding protein YcdF (DUF218 family)